MNQISPVAADEIRAAIAPVYADYMVYKDGRPFLIVNATLARVRRLVEGFAVHQADFAWTFQAYTR